jgi:hypothetical protein
MPRKIEKDAGLAYRKRNDSPILEGSRFGRLVILDTYMKEMPSEYRTRRIAVCACDCGARLEVKPSNLTAGNTQSCGCLHKERSSANLRSMRRTHGEGHSKLYGVWRAMVDRCHNSDNRSFGRYGARGITVCDEWRAGYEPFRDWARSSGYEEGLTIDRVETAEGYRPDNCRWATHVEQARNTRRNRHITAFGEAKLLEDWVFDSRCIVGRGTLYSRLKSGWEAGEAMTLAPHAKPSHRSI